MKTKEEIQQLADKAINKEGYTNDDFIIGFEQGYTQCQQDMAVKKYTEEQLLDAMSFAECYIIEHDKPLFLKSNGKPVPDCLEYIKLLNKQETLEEEAEKNIGREEWINFFKNNSKEEILEYLINYKFPL